MLYTPISPDNSLLLCEESSQKLLIAVLKRWPNYYPMLMERSAETERPVIVSVVDSATHKFLHDKDFDESLLENGCEYHKNVQPLIHHDTIYTQVFLTL